MARIAIDRAPPTALPLLFLTTTPFWGATAGALLLMEGADVLQTRWAPSTLALVHALTLGVLGNAMFGSLLQFLPAAAGVQVRGGARAGRVLHLLLNLGTILLVAGFPVMRPHWLAAAGVVLAMAFALLAVLVMPGLLASLADMFRARDTATGAVAGTTRAGIAWAMVAALTTAALGVAMLWGIVGHRGLPVQPWADVHASWGVLGWGLGLLASVGAVVVPMFQGTRSVPGKAQAAWTAALGMVLVAGTFCVANNGSADLLRWGGATGLLVFAATGVWLQAGAPCSRNTWLVRAWRAGLIALALGAVVLARGGPPVLLGALVLGIGLPWLVAGMQLEIVAFLAWIELHRQCGRGVRLPPVQVLLPDAHKAQVFAFQGLSALTLVVAAMWPTDATARLAGLAMIGCHLLLGLRLVGVGLRARSFKASGGMSPSQQGDARAERVQ